MEWMRNRYSVMMKKKHCSSSPPTNSRRNLDCSVFIINYSNQQRRPCHERRLSQPQQQKIFVGGGALISFTLSPPLANRTSNHHSTPQETYKATPSCCLHSRSVFSNPNQRYKHQPQPPINPSHLALTGGSPQQRQRLSQCHPLQRQQQIFNCHRLQCHCPQPLATDCSCPCLQQSRCVANNNSKETRQPRRLSNN
jgi:hypothetical protein